jgi:hypothetical protein
LGKTITKAEREARQIREETRGIHTIDPVLRGLEVVGSPISLADNGGDLVRLGEEEDPLSIDEVVGYTGEEDKEEEGPTLGHGDRRREERGISSDRDVM